MNNLKVEITKILAYGTRHRFMWLKINDTIMCLRISDYRYKQLKSFNIPTSQSLRGKE